MFILVAIVGFVLLHSDVIEIVPSRAFQRAVAWAFLVSFSLVAWLASDQLSAEVANVSSRIAAEMLERFMPAFEPPAPPTSTTP